MKFGLKTIDIYIIKKFIGTYFFSIFLIICIFIIFDISEKIDDFVGKKAPLDKIVFDYYLTFIPFFLNTFTSLFVFISVIFFTSKMAYNTEIVAILSGGTGFLRMMLPYFVSAMIIFLMSLILSHFVIPPASKIRLAFENEYTKNPFQRTATDMHMQVQPGEYLYISNYYRHNNRALNFSLERFEDKTLTSKLMSDYAEWDSTNRKWRLNDYYIREFTESDEKITSGNGLDTTVNFTAEELKQRDNVVLSMDYFELNRYIEELKMRGTKADSAILEKYNRTSIPFSVFVLTLIGVSISSRKVRGGIGLQIMIGISLSFMYILMLRFSEIFIQIGIAEPIIAAWIPNLLFLGVGIFLYIKAPK